MGLENKGFGRALAARVNVRVQTARPGVLLLYARCFEIWALRD